jgi:hypothetical protein
MDRELDSLLGSGGISESIAPILSNLSSRRCHRVYGTESIWSVATSVRRPVKLQGRELCFHRHRGCLWQIMCDQGWWSDALDMLSGLRSPNGNFLAPVDADRYREQTGRMDHMALIRSMHGISRMKRRESLGCRRMVRH